MNRRHTSVPMRPRSKEGRQGPVSRTSSALAGIAAPAASAAAARGASSAAPAPSSAAAPGPVPAEQPLQARDDGRPIGVVLAGAERYLSGSLVAAFVGAPDFEVTITGPSLGEVVVGAYRGGPGLVVISHQHMAGLSGESIAQLQSQNSAMRFLLCDVPGGSDVPPGLLEIGFDAVCMRCAPSSAILEAARLAFEGRKVAVGAEARIVGGADELDEREREILRMVCSGARNAEIAQALYLAESTVKGQVATMCTKLGVNGRVGLAMAAVRLGLVAV